MENRDEEFEITSQGTGLESDTTEAVSVTTEKNDIEKNNERNSILNLQALNLTELNDLIEVRIKRVGEQAFAKSAGEEGTYENILVSYVDSYSYEAARTLDFLAKANLKDEVDDFAYTLKDDEGKPYLGDTQVYSPKKRYAHPLTGRQAQIAFMARKKKSVRRMVALASGISILLRAPLIEEISSFIQNVTAEEIHYGREAGVQYFSFADLIVKRCCIEFIKDLIVDCSLKGWEAENKIAVLKALKLTDFVHLATIVQALIYPKGYPNFMLACTNPNCDHVSEPITVDLTDFIKHRFAAMPKDCIQFSAKNKNLSDSVDFKALEQYQKKLGIDNQVFEIDEYRYTFTVPSVFDYIVIGSSVVADIETDIVGSKENGAFEAVASRSLLTYLPWISKIEVLIYDEDGDVEPEVQMVFSDTPTISTILSDLIKDVDHEAKLTDKITSLIDEAQITYVCYTPSPCPACGKELETKTGMVSLDPISSFFIMASWYDHQHFLRREKALTSKK